MNKRAVKIFLIVGLLIMNLAFMSNKSHSQWILTDTLLGKYYNSSSYLYVGSDLYHGSLEDGLYKSTNNGDSWTYINFHKKNVTALASSGSILYAGVFGQGIFYTTDSGINWTAINSGLTNLNVRQILITGTDLFAAIDNGGGIYRSTNQGLSWFAVNTGITQLNVKCLAVSGTNLFAGADGGIFLSTNSGVSWSNISSGMTNTNIHCITIKEGYLFAGTLYQGPFPGGIPGKTFRSTDNGLSWTELSTPFEGVYNFAILGNKIFSASDTYIFYSTNNGDNWIIVNPTINGQCFALNGNTICTSRPPYGLKISTDGGITWINKYAYLQSVTSLTVKGGDLYTSTNYGAICKTTNDGTNWLVSNNGISARHTQCVASNATRIFAGTEESGIYISTNDGSSWSPSSAGLASMYISCLNANGTNIFAGTGNGAYVSTNNGDQWVSVGLTTRTINSFTSLGTKVFAATDSGVYLSTNNGSAWSPVNNGLGNLQVRTIIINGSKTIAGTTGSGVFISTNDGTSWSPINNGLTNSDIYSLAAKDTNLFAGTSARVYYSSNNGNSWIKWNQGFPNIDFIVSTLNITNENIIMGSTGFTAQGVWRRPYIQTGIPFILSEIPNNFYLSQNYPNPFNPSTKITYELRTGNYISLKVYDMLGKEIATLIAQKQNAGTYQVTFNSSDYNLPSGIYFYRLEAGSFRESKKMIYLA